MNIEAFEALASDEAIAALRSCCVSERWARAVATDRPYGSRIALLDAATMHWAQADEAELLTAFAAHPRIGDIELLRARYATGSETANAEQGQVLTADDAVLERLRDQNDVYFERFGFIFIVCATGKSASEMLALLDARIGNDRATELANAAREQGAIMILRMEKLISEEADA
jgi:2-oxo-4-hydroxy-4-carboxy-5-ureidoimidazoline decarboxylase